VKLEIAKRLLQDGMKVQKVSELTGLAIEELKANGLD
jgi:predicted transposase YdaD